MNNIKLEVGKTYRTRSGKKVEDLKLNDSAVFPFRGLIKGIGWDIYQENGLYDVIEGAGDDIVAEWEDPTEIDMTVSRDYLESKPESILQEAERLINGDRAEAYGDAKTMFDNIAIGWSVIFGKEVTGKQVALAMAWLKICRENNKSKRDNIVDGAAYLALIEKL